MDFLKVSIFFLSGLTAGIIVVPLVLSLLREAGLVRPNFREEEIPIGAGMSFLLSLLIAYLPLNIFYTLPRSVILSFFLGLWGISFLGFVDDVLGTHFARGFTGHFKSLFRGRLTTGGLKALGGGLLALFVSLSWNDLSDLRGVAIWVIDGLLMALFTNSLNLFDLRPGRAAKVFIILAIILSIAALGRPQGYLLLTLLGAVTALLPWDLGARAMMGDTGSNILGMSLGIVSALTLGTGWKIVLLIVLLAFHVFTEKYSLTKIIEKNRVLSFLDMLGRPRQEKRLPGKN